jgi:hypothetical protein
MRKILAFIAGLITFFIVVSLMHLLNGLIFGMPSPDVYANPEKMTAYVAGMSTGAFVGVLVTYIVGSFASGFVMRILSRWDSLILPVVIGLIGTAGWAYNINQIQHPMWVTVLGFFCYLPFAILGHRAAQGSGSRG